MLRNYFIIAWRNLWKHKLYSLINILGLAVGMTGCALIMLYVIDETSYDKFHSKADQIYRIITPTDARLPLWFGPMLRDNLPGVSATMRIHGHNTPLISHGDKRFFETIHFVEGNIFEFFDITFIYGDPQTALMEPGKMVISTEIADKYFGAENPIGKILRWDSNMEFEVTGVVEVPPHTHFHFNILVSESTIYNWMRPEEWNGNPWQEAGSNFYSFTYLLLEDGVDPGRLANRTLELVSTAKGSKAREMAEKWGGFELQALTDIHLNSRLPKELEANGDINNIKISVLVALLILLVGCINFINLSTARAVKRAREIGIRKAIGAQRRQLVFQFLGESILLSLGALILALGLVQLSLPFFNTFFDKDLVLWQIGDPVPLIGVIVLAIFVGTASGFYPAIYLSGFHPIKVLKGLTIKSGTYERISRKGLVVFQFAISIGLIIAAMLVYNQMNYLKNKNLGFNKEHVLSLFISYPGLNQKMPTVQEVFEQHSKVISTASFAELPSIKLDWQGSLRPVDTNESMRVSLLNIEPSFIELFGLKMLAGRPFSKDILSDRQNALILNRAAVDMLGLKSPEDAVGTYYEYSAQVGGRPVDPVKNAKVVGVVENFHFEPLHQTITPMAFFYVTEFWAFEYTGIRIQGEHIAETVAFVVNTWDEFIPEFPITYKFLDEDYDVLYRSEERLGTMLTMFSGLAVVIACLGVFALAVFTIEQRTREISIRKVLGASEWGLTTRLTGGFILPVLYANLVAWPLVYFTMSGWLQNFPYRVEMTWETFVISGLFIILIACLTVGYQSLKASRVNPADILRNE